MDKLLDWKFEEHLEQHPPVSEQQVEQGCYWHDVVGCVCDEPDLYSDAEGGL